MCFCSTSPLIVKKKGLNFMLTEKIIFPDPIIQIPFELKKFSVISINLNSYIQLCSNCGDYVVGSGKTSQSYSISHSSAGFVDINFGEKGYTARWLSDPFEISGVVVDENQNHFADITAGGVTHRIPFEELLPDKISAALYKKGIAIETADRAHEALSKHIQKILSGFDVIDARIILGWSMRGDKLVWSENSGKQPLLQSAMKEETEEAYINQLNRLIEDSEYLQFTMAAASASVLMGYLNLTEKLPVDPFGVSLTGTSSTGKTTALKLAASLFSNPDDESVFSGFNATKNAMVSMLGRHFGVPMCYDESTIRNDGFSTQDFIYIFTQGKEKARLNSDSTLKARSQWLCTALFSSENYLVDMSKNSNLGLGARIITLDQCHFTNSSKHADEIKKFAGENYGILGNMMSQKLINKSTSETVGFYQRNKEIITERLNGRCCSLTDRIVSNYAFIVTAGQILAEISVNIDIDKIIDICVDLHDALCLEAEPGKNLVIQIFNYISCNFGKHSGIKWVLNNEKRILAVDILEADFEAILAKTVKTEKKTAVRHLLDEGFIVRSEKKRIKKKISIDGAVSYGYSFDMKKVEEAFGPITDEVYSNIKKFKDYDPQYERLIEVENDEEAIIHAGNYKIRCNEETAIGRAFLL